MYYYYHFRSPCPDRVGSSGRRAKAEGARKYSIKAAIEASANDLHCRVVSIDLSQLAWLLSREGRYLRSWDRDRTGVARLPNQARQASSVIAGCAAPARRTTRELESHV